MDNRARLEELGIILKGNENKTTCPQCSHARKNKRDKCLSVNVEMGTYNCFNCGWKGGIFMKKEQSFGHIPQKLEYAIPTDAQMGLPLSDKNLEALAEKRGLPLITLKDFDIREKVEWMPKAEKDVKTLCFVYRNADGLPVNVKYRSADKGFKQVKDAKKIFYGLDKYEPHEEFLLICEGEFDLIAFHAAGIKCTISLPDGAIPPNSNPSDKKFEYLQNCRELFDNKKTVFIATDNDPAGNAMAEELARRIGYWRCQRVKYPEGCKDANEVLQKHGIERLANLAAEAWPINGVVNFSSVFKEIDTLYEKGLQKGHTIGLTPVDEIITWKQAEFTVWTGAPGSGKSRMVENIAVELAKQYGWRIGFYSPEHQPLEYYFSIISQMYLGKPFSGAGRMTPTELNSAKDFFDEYFYSIQISEKDSLTIDELLEIGRELVFRNGINMLVIDPYNKLTKDYGKLDKLDAINEILNKINRFKRDNNCAVHLIAHPRKPERGQKTPTLYDIAHSSDFANQCDNGIIISKEFDEEKQRWTHLFRTEKVKFAHTGIVSKTLLWYNVNSAKFMPLSE